MSKKKVFIVEYRYDSAAHWTKYAETSVAGILSLYTQNCQKEHPGAEVRYR